MKTIKYFIFVLSLCGFLVGKAQQETLYTQYFFSQLVINPAYAGNDDALSLSGFSRKQWFGINGSPLTNSILAHTSLSNTNSECRVFRGDSKKGKGHLVPVKNRQIGLGLIFFSDRIGVSNTLLSSFSYSYKIKFNSETRLSFGLQGTAVKFDQTLNDLENPDLYDPLFQENISAIKFNAGAGIYFETDRFYIGGSIPEIIENKLDQNGISGETQLRQYFISGAILFYLNRLLKFKPSFLVRKTEGLPVSFDLNANILFHDMLWTGISYRNKTSLNFTTVLLTSDYFKVGFAYDYALGEISKSTFGSAEIMLGYIFHKPGKKIINPRYL